MTGCYGRNPQLLMESTMKEFAPPAPSFDRIPNGEKGHEQDWVHACEGGKPAASNSENPGPLYETVPMGNLAVRFHDRLLLWDGEKMEVTNDSDANACVRRQCREGRSL